MILMTLLQALLELRNNLTKSGLLTPLPLSKLQISILEKRTMELLIQTMELAMVALNMTSLESQERNVELDLTLMMPMAFQFQMSRSKNLRTLNQLPLLTQSTEPEMAVSTTKTMALLELLAKKPTIN